MLGAVVVAADVIWQKSDASKIIVRDAKANRFLNNEIGERSRVDTFVKKTLKTDEQRPF